MAGSIRVLHVEDDPALVDVVAEFLQQEDDGFEMCSAGDAEEGLRRIAEGDVDCVVSDYDMPGMNGIEFLEAIREDHPDLPFLLFTGKGSEEVASEAISAGVTDYLQKGGGSDQYTILANRVQNAVESARAHRERKEMRERMEFALEATDSVIYEFDPDTGTATRHGPTERVYGIDPASVPTTREFYERAVHPEDREKVVRILGEEAVEGGLERVAFEFRTDPENGRSRWLHTEARLRTGPNEASERLVGLTTDVTDRKERERELAQQNARLEEFDGVISRDLREPVNVARAGLDLAREDCDSSHLDTVERGLDRVEALTDDLLTLAREGESVREQETVDLRSLVEERWGVVDAPETTLAVETDRLVRADPDRLGRLVENLLQNAVDHGGSTAYVGDLPDGFFVEDDGPGIPETKRVQVFESGYSTASDRTGFGLALVRRVARAHGWSVRAAEAESGGVRFEVRDVDPVE